MTITKPLPRPDVAVAQVSGRWRPVGGHCFARTTLNPSLTGHRSSVRPNMCADRTWTKASDRLMISPPGLRAANRLRSRERSDRPSSALRSMDAPFRPPLRGRTPQMSPARWRWPRSRRLCCRPGHPAYGTMRCGTSRFSHFPELQPPRQGAVRADAAAVRHESADAAAARGPHQPVGASDPGNPGACLRQDPQGPGRQRPQGRGVLDHRRTRHPRRVRP
jgi:hypothetical protein